MKAQSNETVIIHFNIIESIKANVSPEIISYWNDFERNTLLDNIFNTFYKYIPVVGDKLDLSFFYNGYRDIVKDFKTHSFLVTTRTLLLDNDSPELEDENYTNSINATWIIDLKPIYEKH
ncbi:hypothetical protein SAMN05421594_0731 [Chryseobacterium oleae]|uniref:Uncharacterized protein n=1 Tax=Chryseobacterium oleae TaxID=491207 RepID=A0A1I4VY50_CHROL|nr:hypothetical protein [Chryseobacterium oleae]SFN06152.1 hypothetical protein SAMN05421594_0731 [Chryseobacterium oleae]